MINIILFDIYDKYNSRMLKKHAIFSENALCTFSYVLFPYFYFFTLKYDYKYEIGTGNLVFTRLVFFQ